MNINFLIYLRENNLFFVVIYWINRNNKIFHSINEFSIENQKYAIIKSFLVILHQKIIIILLKFGKSMRIYGGFWIKSITTPSPSMKDKRIENHIIQIKFWKSNSKVFLLVLYIFEIQKLFGMRFFRQETKEWVKWKILLLYFSQNANQIIPEY